MKSRLRKTVALMLAFCMLLGSSSFAYAAENSVDSVTARNAIIQEVTGTGTAQTIRNSNPIQAAKGIRLQAGDRLKTSQDVKLYINIDGKSVIRLDEQSEAEISNALFGKIRINLIAGRLFYNIAKTTDGNESLEFMSNNITIAIRGTSGMLGYGNGAVESLLFDGTIAVAVNGVSVEQKPAEEIFIKAEPGKPAQECITRKEITLNDIPASVIAEMQKDPALKEKIVKSVPAGKDAAGNPIFGDINTDITSMGKADNTMMPYSAPVKPQTSSSSGSGSGGSSKPTPKPEPAKCGGCGKPLSECASEMESHTLTPCTRCEANYYPCTNGARHNHWIPYACGHEGHGAYECKYNTEEAAKHEWAYFECVTGNEEHDVPGLVSESQEHGAYKCDDDWDSEAEKHKFVPYACFEGEGHYRYACMTDATSSHARYATCDYCGKGLYECTNRGNHGDGNCNRTALTSMMPPSQLNAISKETGIDIADKSDAQYPEKPEAEKKPDAEVNEQNAESSQKQAEQGAEVEPEIQASPENIQKEIEEEQEEQPKETPEKDNETN